MHTTTKLVRLLTILFLISIFLIPQQFAYAAGVDIDTNDDLIDANGGTCAGMVIADLPGGNGTTSLREAICAANGTAGIDTLTFSVSGPITLGSALPEISTTMSIDSGSNTIIVDGANTYQIFYVTASGNLTLNDLTIQNGSGEYAGGIRNDGILTVTNSTFSGNSATLGGAISNYDGTLSITNSTFSNNSATVGGGIYNDGTLSITNSTFSGNTSTNNGGGILNYTGGPMSITGSTFSGNSSSGRGGGINNFGALTITNTTFSNNSASFDGGGISNEGTLSVTKSTFSSNSANDDGGGIFNSGTLTVSDSTLSNNFVNDSENLVNDADGGGMFNSGMLTVTNSTLSGNSSSDKGGGILNSGTLAVADSTFFNNYANWWGGGIYNDGTLTITNSTFSSNLAIVAGGGGILNSLLSDSLWVTNSTFSGNQDSASGGAIYNLATLHLLNTILANSLTGGDCYNEYGNSIATNVNNLIETNSANGNMCGTPALTSDPLLGALTNNGGPTDTFLPAWNSDAVDNGHEATCAADVGSPKYGAGNLDQRGVTRPAGGCEIGAVERDPDSPIVVSTNLITNYSITGPSAFTVIFNVNISNLGGGSDPDDVENPANYLLVEEGINGAFDTITCDGGLQADDTQALVNNVTYNNGSFTATVNINGGAGLPVGNYRLFICGTTSIVDPANIPLNGGTDTLINFSVEAPPTVSTNSLLIAYPVIGPSSFTVTFSKDVSNPSGITDPDDVENPANYLLVEEGINSTFDTLTCDGGLQADDTQVTVNNVTYNNGSFTATVNINGGTSLPIGNYRLFVCGTTSIIDHLNAPLNGGTDTLIDFSVEAPPTVSTNSLLAAYPVVGPSSFTVTFSKDVSNPSGNTDPDDVENPANYLLVEEGVNGVFDTLTCDGGLQADDTQVSVNSVSYNSGSITATVNINGGTGLPIGIYRLFICGTTSIVDSATNSLNGGADTLIDFSVEAPPTVSNNNLVSAYITVGPSSFMVTFSKNVINLGGGTDPDDVENPANYLLVEEGINRSFDTLTCDGGLQADDTQVTVDNVSYDQNTYTATVNINGGTGLPIGNYRLFVCGTTSIIDPATNPLNGGEDTLISFYVRDPVVLPDTGFARGHTTILPAHPSNKIYLSTDMLLEIPSLNVEMSITGVPQTDESWDVTWLNQDAGWLAGSAYPTWQGNTVITGHVWDAYNQPGPFAQLKSLKYGDRFFIHAYGQTYTYEVRDTKLVTIKNTEAVFQSEEYDWVTLLTCEFYNPFTANYLFRRIVRAVLIEVSPN